jgi:Mg2+-importing ATPase
MTTLLIMGIGAYLPYSPLAATLGFVPLPGLYWLLLAATLLCYVGLTQVIKMWLIRKAWV